MRLTIMRGPAGSYLLQATDGRSVLIQTDWDYPSLAAAWGWTACACGTTDGTVDCPHRTASEMLAEAAEFLDDRIGTSLIDPGYLD